MASLASNNASAPPSQGGPPKRPRVGQTHRLIHQALDNYDLTAISDFVRISNLGVAIPRALDEFVGEALLRRLRGLGLTLGNHA